MAENRYIENRKNCLNIFLSLHNNTFVGFVAAAVSASVTVGGCRAVRPVASLLPAVVADVAVL